MSIRPDLDKIRSTDPPTWPQYPFESPPRVPETSPVKYTIREDLDIFIPMRDGVKLSADVFRPSAPGQKFPALVATSPYTRQLQRTAVTSGQNESGIHEFWVPRGYAHVIVDIRGTNDSEGSWDHFGPQEQRDLFDIIEWTARQPWCDGNVGMTGESYFALSQTMAATMQPPHLKAIFPFCASVDIYRDRYFNGGIFSRGTGHWFHLVRRLSMQGGRLKDPSGIQGHMKTVLAIKYPFDGPYYQERFVWPRLDQIKIPTYFACLWGVSNFHLRGATEGWVGVGDIPKRMLIGPGPKPRKPMAAYHMEALRWYDHHLKGINSGAMEGPPIQLYVEGLNKWRGENEWPLARTQWKEFFLAGETGIAPRKLVESAGRDGQASYNYEPLSYEAYRGGPKLTYRSEPLAEEMELVGPVVLHLWASSTATDTDWFVTFNDEAPDGHVRELSRGWLRASHRELDPVRSKPWRPFHPHLKADPLVPKQAYEFAIEIWPVGNLFKAGHRLNLEIASCDDQTNMGNSHLASNPAATNTILEGRSHPSRLLVPVIPCG
jgi:predicted acyl esterase